jgi:imidazolonepropionase-like amidohydrolase
MSFKSVALACGLVLAGAGARAETIYLTAARMVDPAAGKVVADPAVVIVDDRVTAVGTAGALAPPAGARRIDLAGKTILPGLIDMHTHITSRSDMHGYRALAVSVPAEGISGVANAGRTLQAGFTTLRNVGAPGFVDVARCATRSIPARPWGRASSSPGR